MKILVALICMAVSSLCVAGNQGGVVADIFVRASDGLIYFDMSGGPKVGSPGCATFSYWIIRNENSIVGQQQYQLLLAAQANQRTITVVGSNTCARWSDGEDVDSILLVSP
jgi:hypothetical protein